MAKVAFDGSTKVITITYMPTASGTVELDAEVDFYSDWKEWVIASDNIKYLEAVQTVAGDPISSDQYISPYFFLINGWRIRPYEQTHQMIINGNLFVEGGEDNPFIPTIGAYNVMVRLNTTVNAVTTVISASGGGASADDIWNAQSAEHLFPGTMGYLVTQTANQVGELHSAQIVATGTVGAGSTTTKINTTSTKPNDFYNGMYIMVIGVAGSVVRKIDLYVNAQGAFYVTDALPFVPAALDVFVILNQHNEKYGSID